MDDATFRDLTQINDHLVDLCNWLKETGEMETVLRLTPILDRLTRLLIQIAEKRLRQ